MLERYIGKKCLVRCVSSGVFYGIVTAIDGTMAEIKDSRKVYRWYGANCLEQLSVDGSHRPSDCQLTIKSDNIVNDWCQLLICSEKAIKSLDEVEEWKL